MISTCKGILCWAAGPRLHLPWLRARRSKAAITRRNNLVSKRPTLKDVKDVSELRCARPRALQKRHRPPQLIVHSLFWSSLRGRSCLGISHTNQAPDNAARALSAADTKLGGQVIPHQELIPNALGGPATKIAPSHQGTGRRCRLHPDAPLQGCHI